MLFPIAIICGLLALTFFFTAFFDRDTTVVPAAAILAVLAAASIIVSVRLSPNPASVIRSSNVQETSTGIYTLTANGNYYAVVNTAGETVLLPTERTVLVPNAETPRFEQWDEVPSAPKWLVADLTEPSYYRLYVP